MQKIAFAINTAKHEATGFQPIFLNFGRYVPLSGDYYGEIESTDDIQLLPEKRDSYAVDIAPLSDIFRNIREKLHKAYNRNARTYNLRRRNYNFEVGMRVWRRNKVLSDASKKFSAKLAPKYVLRRVHQRVSGLCYNLENLDGSPDGKWHVKDLKPYFGSNSDVSVS